MPKGLVKSAWGQNRNLQALADTFGVSLPAARVRASYLGLLDATPRCVTPVATWDHLGATYFRMPHPLGAMAS